MNSIISIKKKKMHHRSRFLLVACLVVSNFYVLFLNAFGVPDSLEDFGIYSKYELTNWLPRVFYAVRYENIIEIKELLTNFNSLKKYYTPSGRVSLLKFAQHWRKVDVVEYILEQHNYDIKKYVNKRVPLFHFLISNFKYKAIEKLLAKGFDPNIKNSKGCSPLGLCTALLYHYFNKKSSKKVIYILSCMKLFVCYGGYITDKAFDENIYKKNDIIIEFIIPIIQKRGLEEYYYQLYNTGLLFLLKNSLKKQLRCISRIPIKVICFSYGDRHSLIHAITDQQPKVMRNAHMAYLLSREVPIDIQDGYGNTGLHRALMNKDRPLIHLLISRGASLLIENNLGISPMHLLIENNRLHSLFKRLLDICFITNNKNQWASKKIEKLFWALTFT